MSQTFVKASGGCSAPAVKNSKDALASMGQMKLRQFVPPAEETMTKAQELQLMIQHPNNSGLQRDPLTQYFIPAHFVQNLSISQGDRLILAAGGRHLDLGRSQFPLRFRRARQRRHPRRSRRHRRQGFTDKWPLDLRVSDRCGWH